MRSQGLRGGAQLMPQHQHQQHHQLHHQPMVPLHHMSPLHSQQHQQRQPVVRIQHAVQPQLHAARQPPTLQQWAAQAAASPAQPSVSPAQPCVPLRAEVAAGGECGKATAARKGHAKRPDPAAAEAAAMGPVGDRRRHKPRKLLYGERLNAV